MNFGSVAAALSENRPQYFTADFNHALSVTPCDIMLLQSMSKELVGLVIQDYMLDMMAMSPWKPPKKKHQFLIHLHISSLRRSIFNGPDFLFQTNQIHKAQISPKI